jgi:hypothetical protein
MSHLRDAASWYWPRGTYRHEKFVPRDVRQDEPNADPAGRNERVTGGRPLRALSVDPAGVAACAEG